MYEHIAEDLLTFIRKSPTCFQAIANVKEELAGAAFTELREDQSWNIVPGGKYYVTRNDSSLIAFMVPAGDAGAGADQQAGLPRIPGYRIIASHSDSPSFKIKPNAEMESAGAYIRLNVESYGGGIYHTWFDRPLGIAGRVVLREKDAEAGTPGRIVSRNIFIDEDLLIIPSLAIHMKHDVNSNLSLNVQEDLLPLFGDASEKGALAKIIAEAAGCAPEDILAEDLFLVARTEPTFLGASKEFIASPRLDDLECVYGSLRGFLGAVGASQGTEGAAEGSVPGDIAVLAVFDNEEVGSTTKQGAASTFLSDTMERIAEGLDFSGDAYHQMLAKSFMVSADNAHAVHPNAAGKADPVNRPQMNKGIVLKHNAAQKYTTDAISGAIFKAICKDNDVPFQEFTNRSDERGGSTLGNIANTQVSMNTVDIGLPQLGMHSCYETAGAKDPEYLARFSEGYYRFPDVTVG